MPIDEKRSLLLIIFVAVLYLLASVTGAHAQPPECALPAPGEGNPTNPTRVCFTVPVDHVDIANYMLDILDGAGTVIQTIDMGKPTPDAQGWVSWDMLNVMPVRFGTYTMQARSIGVDSTTNQPVSGPPSVPSNNWDRAPGRPGGPRVVQDLTRHVPIAS